MDTSGSNSVGKKEGERLVTTSVPSTDNLVPNDAMYAPQEKTQNTGTKSSMWKWTSKTRNHIFAFVLVLATAVVPLIILGEATSPPYAGRAPFSSLFLDKVISCGGSIGGRPANSTITGMEKVFALDMTFGQYTFSQVKAIDIAWDTGMGRGLQLVASWASYIIFCDALLKSIERHPASFITFQRIALEGPRLKSIATLMVELWAAKSKRTKALFFYMLWSTAYIITLPIVIGAMTGYDATAVAWIDIEGVDNIVPASSVKETWMVKGTVNETFVQPACVDKQLKDKYSWIVGQRLETCDCQIPNGTRYSGKELESMRLTSQFYEVMSLGCIYNFTSNAQTWEGVDFPDRNSRKTYSCNSTMPVTIKDKTYDAQDLVTSSGYCHQSIAYNETYLEGKSRCLPDTAHPSYEWGFSTLLSGLFVFVTSAWVISMYILWLDSQRDSTLVQMGYRMTPLRAAFAMARAARQRTGYCEKQLVRADTEALEKELYGHKGSRKTKVDFGVFVEDTEGGEECTSWCS